MRVLMLTWEYPPLLVGGLARHVDAVSREIAARGIRVDVLTRGGDGLPTTEERDGVQIHRVTPYFGHPADFRAWAMHLNFALCEAAVQVMEQVGARDDVVVHGHDWLVAYASRFIKTTYRVPMVMTIHATEHGRMNGIHGETQSYIHDVEWWSTYEAWRVIVCSQAMRREVASLFRVPADKLVVIPNGVDDEVPSGQMPARARFAAPGEPLIFHIGRLVPEKGASVLLEAFARLPRGRLVIAGGGPWEKHLRERAEKLGVGDRVRFAGFVDDATRAALFHHADVTVVPSTYEPFGIVALEAMAMGSPVVVSDVGGLAEIIQHGVTGLKVKPGSPTELAAQIQQVLGNPCLAARLRHNARQEVERTYRWRSVAAATELVYGQVLADRHEAVWGPLNLPMPLPVEGEVYDRYTV